MINSLCGSMGSLKSELTRSDMSSCSKGQPTSPTASVSESNIVASSSDLDQNNHINPSANSFQGIKFEEVDVEVQSPDNSLWESLFADQIDLGTDFMISSPRRWDFMVSSPRRGDYMISSPKRGDLMMISSPKRGDWMISSPKRGEYMISSPKRSDYMISSPKRGEYVISSPKRGECWMISSPKRAPLLPHPNYTANNCGYVQGLHGQPNPLPTSYGTAHIGHSSKAKSSPLHKVYNSTDTFVHPDNYMLPPLDSLLDDHGRDNNYGSAAAYPPMTKMSGVGSSSESFDPPGGSVPGMYYVPQVTRPCESVSEMDLPANSLRVNLMRESYQMSSYETASSTLPHHASTSQQQQQQLQLLVQQQQHQETLEQGLAKVVPSECEQEQDSGLELVHLLLACAEAVAKEDYMLARKYLHHLNRVVSPLGDSMQRVAACFTEALSAKLTATITTSPTTSSNLSNSLEILKIYQILYQACPYIKFAHFTANQAIFEAFDLEERVHVIDLDILQGYQWPAFMQALAARPGGAPFLRITGVGSPLELVRETGRRLTELAQSLHVPFQFHPVGESLEELQPHMFHRRVGEALAVNAVNRLHHVPGNCLGNLIGMIRDQAPNIVTLVEQEASHNGPYFLGRFLEALHYYSAIFDSLDATFPADSPERAKLEQYIFAPEIRNIVACEGAERKERHERLEKWRKIMEGKGFKGVPLSSNAVTQSKILLGLYPCDGYRLTEEKGCLLLGWQDRAIIAASAWRC